MGDLDPLLSAVAVGLLLAGPLKFQPLAVGVWSQANVLPSTLHVPDVGDGLKLKLIVAGLLSSPSVKSSSMLGLVGVAYSPSWVSVTVTVAAACFKLPSAVRAPTSVLANVPTNSI